MYPGNKKNPRGKVSIEKEISNLEVCLHVCKFVCS